MYRKNIDDIAEKLDDGMFRIIFVLDILNGIAVHAIRGERSKYQPVQGSVISNSPVPSDMITALLPREIYIADLNYLQHLGDNFELIAQIAENVETMVDIGPEKMSEVEICSEIADTVILGTETVDLDLIERAAARYPGRIDVSIDMKNGRVLTSDKKMAVHPEELVKILNGYPIKDIILLDLAKVGTSQGIDRVFFRDIQKVSEHDIIAGGGIRDMEDIEILKKIGVSGALVATAVHNGKIPVEFIR